MAQPRWTEAAVVAAVRGMYDCWHDPAAATPPEWALVEQVAFPDGAVGRRVIDVVAFRCWSSGQGLTRTGIEVKVSRGDYKRETWAKRAPVEAACHRTLYAAPAGLIDPDTLPDGWGLIEVDGTPEAPTARRVVPAAPRTPTVALDLHLAWMARRVAATHDAHLTAAGMDPAAVADLAAERDRLAAAHYRAQQAARREKARADRWMHLAAGAAAATHECSTCGGPLRARWQSGTALVWVHARPGADDTCYEARAVAHAAARTAETGAAYLIGYAPPPEPVWVRDARAAADTTDEETA